MSNPFNKITNLNYKGTSGNDNYDVKSKQFNDLVDDLNTYFPEGVFNIDNIVEKTGDNGVNIEGINLTDYIISGNRVNIISANSIDTAGAVSLTVAQSGSTILLDKADGLTITLPVDAVGLTYKFVSTVNLTSSNYVIQGNASSDLFKGGVLLIDDATPEVATMFKPDNNDDYILTMNGTTTGGEIGTDINITCVASNVWYVSGTIAANGTLATPFS